MSTCSRSSLLFFCLVTLGCESPQIEASDRLRGLTPLARPSTNAHRRAAEQTDALVKSGADKTITIEGTGRFVGQRPAGEPQSEPAETNDGVTLNLVNVPTAQAAKAVLGDVLSVRYTIDPAVKGQITLQTPRPVSKAAIVDLFQSALRSNGAAIVNVNGLHKIVSADQAVAGAPIELETGAKHKVGSRLHIVQLKYVAASEIPRVLEPIAPRGGVVEADDACRTITLAGNRQEIVNMKEAIAIFDIDTMKGMSTSTVASTTSSSIDSPTIRRGHTKVSNCAANCARNGDARRPRG